MKKKITLVLLSLFFVTGCDNEKTVSYKTESKKYQKEIQCSMQNLNIEADNGMKAFYLLSYFSYNEDDEEFLNMNAMNIKFNSYNEARSFYELNKEEYFTGYKCELKKKEKEIDCIMLGIEKEDVKKAVQEAKESGFICEETK